MQASDVYRVLKAIGVTELHHANTVTTSSTFLEHGGLLSRGFVEAHGLKQTPQKSDRDDKKYRIWNCIFLDHVDIHDRAGRRKGPNQYGPVLFLLDLDVLLKLPGGTKVVVAKENPIYWDDKPESDRWFENEEELSAAIRFGDFGKMLIIRTPSGTLDFPNHEVRIILDNPQAAVSSGEDAYNYAVKRLNKAALAGKVSLSIEPRNCPYNCICLEEYAKYSAGEIDNRFLSICS